MCLSSLANQMIASMVRRHVEAVVRIDNWMRGITVRILVKFYW